MNIVFPKSLHFDPGCCIQHINLTAVLTSVRLAGEAD